MARRALDIVVAAPVAATPHQAGSTWAMFQYLLGLRRLGHRVVFIDPLPPSALQPVGGALHESLNAVAFRQALADFGFDDPAALLLTGTRDTIGMSYDTLRNRVRSADLLLNVSGTLKDDEFLAGVPRRVYLDIDPGFTQLWQAQGVSTGMDRHTDFVTIGKGIGTPESPIPTLGLSWIHTLQPIVLEHWPAADRVEIDAFTTIANWRSYGSIRHEGVAYGQKVHALREFLSVPRLTGERFAVALAIDPGDAKDIAALEQSGWQLLDPVATCGTPARYRSFIQQSRGEFGIAKSGYVAGRCGWISDRSICYLASGKPVLAHDTGPTGAPTGCGLLPFSNVQDVLAGVTMLRDDYPTHARAARAVAEEYFDSDHVLDALLRKLGA